MTNQHDKQEDKETGRKKPIDYTVDGEPQTTTEQSLTPRAILTAAGINPETHYLVEVKGNTTVSYKDKPDEALHMHQHMKFISSSMGPTPVSAR